MSPDKNKVFLFSSSSLLTRSLFSSTSQVNTLTMEWRDGLMALSVRHAVNDTTDDHKWVICDGPVDALWIENMNTVLDDNKMLCMANSERIKLTPSIHMLFEVRAEFHAFCFSVYLDEFVHLHWGQPFFKQLSFLKPKKC